MANNRYSFKLLHKVIHIYAHNEHEKILQNGENVQKDVHNSKTSQYQGLKTVIFFCLILNVRLRRAKLCA